MLINFAAGAPGVLPEAQLRASAIQAVLRVLNNPNVEYVPSILSEPGVAVMETMGSHDSQDHGMFSRIRLLPPRDHHKENRVRERLIHSLAEGLFHDPPYEFDWIHDYDETAKAIFVDGVTSSNKRLSDVLHPDDLDQRAHWFQLLSLRGLLAMGIAEQTGATVFHNSSLTTRPVRIHS